MKQSFITIPIRQMNKEDIELLNKNRKLSLSLSDIEEIKKYFVDMNRDMTDVEIEILAQTWSEHCKHRTFNAEITVKHNGKEEIIDNIFSKYIKEVTEDIMSRKPGFVLSAFEDNAGFIRIDDNLAACFKVETHNHPSALEPYGGANTGIGGVIRDILGAGKGAYPIANIDVFCFGPPDTDPEKFPSNIIHPRGIMRGVVKGVRDYGNRMGIPTVSGAINFDEIYIYNPLIYCGTAGVLPVKDIEKKVIPGTKIILVGGKTGKDGLKGATFSSISLNTSSREEDRSAVQTGNPIEEKKVMDFTIKAREFGLIEAVTDCGAGGLSSAIGEMAKHTGARVYLENVPLKESDMSSWEIFLSESQERMIMSVKKENIGALKKLAGIYEVECTELGEFNNSGKLKVIHFNSTVCDMDCWFLHKSPQKKLTATPGEIIKTDVTEIEKILKSINKDGSFNWILIEILSDIAVCSREPVIREYDHEVQGNTVVKPLTGKMQSSPSDGSVLRIDNSEKYLAIGVSLFPQYCSLNAKKMGKSCIDEAVRQVVVCGADPERIAVLDNFCAGNPEDENELYRIVAAAKGMSETARSYEVPFVSGKDSFYNCYADNNGKIYSIPVTLLISSMGIIEDASHIITTNLKENNSLICIAGATYEELGGSVLYRYLGIKDGSVPDVRTEISVKIFKAYYSAVKKGLIISGHDISEGGLAIAVSEMGFAADKGIEINLPSVPVEDDISIETVLFSESNSRLIFEIKQESIEQIKEIFTSLPFAVIGKTTDRHEKLIITGGNRIVVDLSLEVLKEKWSKTLERLY